VKGRGKGRPIRFTSLPRQQTYHIACEFLKRCSTIQCVFQLKFKIKLKKRNKKKRKKEGKKKHKEKWSRKERLMKQWTAKQSLYKSGSKHRNEAVMGLCKTGDGQSRYNIRQK